MINHLAYTIIQTTELLTRTTEIRLNVQLHLSNLTKLTCISKRLVREMLPWNAVNNLV